MLLSRMRFNREAIRDPRYARLVMGPYQIHAAVWNMFSDESVTERDYLYRVDESSRVPVIYTLSERPPVSDSLVWDVDTMPFKPVLYAGKRLSFSLRVNPVVTRSSPRTGEEDGEKKHYVCHRHDVVMDMKKKLDEGGSRSSLSMGEIMQETGTAWLSRRGEKSGFSCFPGSVIAGGYRQFRFIQKKKGRENKVTISVLDLDGILEVTDPEVFLSALKTGFGPAKGFGCGLMLIRPA